jgi:hypothetical protein
LPKFSVLSNVPNGTAGSINILNGGFGAQVISTGSAQPSIPSIVDIYTSATATSGCVVSDCHF